MSHVSSQQFPGWPLVAQVASSSHTPGFASGSWQSILVFALSSISLLHISPQYGAQSGSWQSDRLSQSLSYVSVHFWAVFSVTGLGLVVV